VVILTHCEPPVTKEAVGMAQFYCESKYGIFDQFCKNNDTSGQKLSGWLYSLIKKFPLVKAGSSRFETDALHSMVADAPVDNKILDSRTKRTVAFKNIYSALENSLMPFFSTFKVLVENQIVVDRTVYSNSGPSYRQCPCGLIWFRVFGCDGIICGRRSQNSKDWSNSTFYDFTIEWENSELSWKKAPKEAVSQTWDTTTEFVGLRDEEKKANLQRSDAGKALIEPVGCGRSLSWKEMKDVTKESEAKLREFDFMHTDVSKVVEDNAESCKPLLLGVPSTNAVPVPNPAKFCVLVSIEGNSKPKRVPVLSSSTVADLVTIIRQREKILVPVVLEYQGSELYEGDLLSDVLVPGPPEATVTLMLQ